MEDMTCCFRMAVPTVPLDEKVCLNVEAAAGYFGIGKNSLRKLIKSNPDANYLFHVGRKTLIIRTAFESFIQNNNYI